MTFYIHNGQNWSINFSIDLSKMLAFIGIQVHVIN